jgi:undecaprenyl diphosphate synthase
MDGNGRWAQNRNLERIFGHQAGLKNIKNIVESCMRKNIQYLTLFAFSTENFFRERDEVEDLIKLFDYALDEYRQFIIDNNCIFKFIGDLSILPEKIKNKILNLENETNNNKKMTLIIAFNYGGRNDIVNATKNIFKKIQNNELKIDNLNEKIFQNHLYTKNILDPDLLIRTGGHKRLSNFLLWQLSYTELFFCDDYWPDFDEDKLNSVLEDYFLRNRNFGTI